jgi:hypothetical protein
MKKLALAIVAFIAMNTPAYADTVRVPTTPDVPVTVQTMSFKELDEQTKRYRLDETPSFQLNQYTAIGRIPLVPFQTYAGSPVWSRRMVGVSLSFKF